MRTGAPKPAALRCRSTFSSCCLSISSSVLSPNTRSATGSSPSPGGGDSLASTFVMPPEILFTCCKSQIDQIPQEDTPTGCCDGLQTPSH